MRTKICIILTVLFWTAISFAQTMSQKLNITIGGVTQTATLADNTATQELVNRLQNAPVTVTLSLQNSPTGTEEVIDRAQAVKVVRDGKIHIERNGYTYSIDGKRL